MLTLAVVWVLAVIGGFLALAYVDAAGGWWSGAIALALAAAWEAHLLPPLVVIVLAVLLVVLAIPLNVPLHVTLDQKSSTRQGNPTPRFCLGQPARFATLEAHVRSFLYAESPE